MLSRLQPLDGHPGNPNTLFVDPHTGVQWMRAWLGAANHGGGIPVLITAPMPSAPELLALASTSADRAEVAAATWLLEGSDRTGAYKEDLISRAEEASQRGEQWRAALMVAWGHSPMRQICALPSVSLRRK